MTPWTAAHQASLSFTISLSLLKVMFIGLVMPSNHVILCCPLLLLPSIFPSIRVFSPVSRLFASGGQSIRASGSVLPMNIQGWFSLGLTGLTSLLSKRLSKSLLQHHISKASILGAQPSLQSSSHIPTWLPEKPWLWQYGPLLAKWCLWFLIHCLVYQIK